MGQKMRILVAEDDPTETLLLKRAFAKAGVTVPLHFVRDGQEAIDYFQGQRPFEDRATNPLPSLLLLDLKMPRLDGFQVLEWIRRQSGLRRMLVVVFSSSEHLQDVNRAYSLGAYSYLMKPHSAETLSRLAQLLEKYWGQTNVSPEYQC